MIATLTFDQVLDPAFFDGGDFIFRVVGLLRGYSVGASIVGNQVIGETFFSSPEAGSDEVRYSPGVNGIRNFEGALVIDFTEPMSIIP